MLISLIHPSRGRPEKSVATIERWIDRQTYSNTQTEFIISLDADDVMLPEYKEEYNEHYIVINNNRSAVDAINNGAKVCQGDILIVVSDDSDCPMHWDERIEETTKGKKDWILKTQDGIQKWIITMPVMDRAYYNRFFYIYHPDYQHMFCDTELSCVADLTGRRITSDLLFKHNHYSVTGQKPDAISNKADSTWAQGEKLFIERYKRNFDLKPEDIKGKVTNKGMIDWILKK